jgi:hypothetical protein
MKANHKKAIKITAILAILVLSVIVIFFIDIGYEKCDISAICPKCLQHAYIKEIKIHGLTVYKSAFFSQNPGGIMSPAGFSPRVPQVSPELYTKILDKKCEHNLKKGGVGTTVGFLPFFGLNKDGGYGQWRLYTQRIEVIGALYAAYVNTGNKELAQKTYAMIDAAFPLDDKKMKEANNLIKLVNEQQVTFEKLPAYYIETAKIAKPMFDFETITPRLKQVQTDEQWRQLLSELETGSAAESNM